MVDYLQSIEVSLGNSTAVHLAVAPGLVNDAQRLASEFTAVFTTQSDDNNNDNANVRARFIEFCCQRGTADTSAAAIATALDTSSPHNSLAIFGDALRSAGGSQCLSELRYLNNAHHALTAEFIDRLSRFLALEAQDTTVAHFYPHGMNVAAWLLAQGGSDNISYLDSPPVATPLSGLVQLVRVFVCSRLSGLPISDYVRKFKAVTGYGQGMVIAAAVASATSDEQYVLASQRALGTLMLAGCLPLHVAPEATLHPGAVAEAQQHEGIPTTMMKVRGSPQYVVEYVLNKFNSHFRENPTAKIYLTAIDTDEEFIFSGHIGEIYHFVRLVRSKANPVGIDQSQVPFHKRKPEVQVRFLRSAVAPLYCEHMAVAVDQHMALAAAKGWDYSATADDEQSQLLVPLRASSDGTETLQSGAELARILAESIYTRRVNWPLAIGRAGTTRIVDFSGADSHLNDITRRVTQGYGTLLVSAGVSLALSSTADAGDNWAQVYGPRLVRLAAPGSESKLHLDTPLSRVLGHPAVLVAGVQPTTASVQFVAATAHAGYLAELAVGSVRTKDELRSLIAQLAELQPAGHGIALNCSLAGLAAWQASVIADLRQREHLPIIGVCIDDAVPPVAQASQLICSLQAAGLGYFALKPTTVAQIQQTLDIAQANPSASIVMQWTGGRTGGAHSFEEFHLPIMQMYKRIRLHRNVILVANSGFGDAESALPYVTGAWGQEAGRAHMPFDGVMLGSRAMVAQEARTDDAVKQLIVAAKGMDSYSIESLFIDDNNNGGVESGCGVVSILAADGTPTHVLATRAALLCKHLSESVFSKPKDKQLPLLLAQKDEIIARLNSDFMRPWFGRKTDGSVAELQDMTYAEVIGRLIELLYIKSEQRWIDHSCRQFAAKFIDRTNMRLLSSEVPFAPVIDSEPLFDIVLDEAAYVLRAIPKASTLLVSSEDIQFFSSLCRQWMTENRPLPFIASIDADFADYLLRDPWWQSENLATVVEQDAQRVLVRQGPVSVRYSALANEPIKQILDATYKGITESLASTAPADIPLPLVEYVEYPLPSPARTPAPLLPSCVSVTSTESERTYQLPAEVGHMSESEMPDLDAWLSAIAGPSPSWLRALLTSTWIVQGPHRVRNYVRDIMRPRPGRRVIVELLTDTGDGRSAQVPASVEIRSDDGAKELEISAEEGGVLSLSIFHNNGHIQRALCFDYHYRPQQTPQTPIHELMCERETRVRDFYADMCLMTSDPKDDEESRQAIEDDQLEFATSDAVVTKESVAGYCRTTSTDLSAYPPNSAQALDVPMEFMSVLASRSIAQALVSRRVYCELLTLRQTLSHVELVPGAEPVQIGHSVGCTTRIVEVSSSADEDISTTTVVLRSSLQRGGKPVAKVTSTFACLGVVPADMQFRRVDEPLTRLTIQSADDIAVLEAKEWYLPLYSSDSDQGATKLEIGSVLEFRLCSEYKLGGVGFTQAMTTGSVHLKSALYKYTHIANVDYADGTSCGNPVVEYLAQRASVIGEPAACLFDEDRSGRSRPYCLASGLVAWAPQSTQRSAAAMGTYSPRNTNEYIADLTQLGQQQATVADQWASATVRRFIEHHVANGNPHRLKSYSAQFTGPILAGDQVEVQLTHVGMRCGRLVVEAVARSRMAGSTVVEATCEVAPPRTAYMFTGQGSQEQGMGFDLYETSEVVRHTYDRADRHMRERFGFSILDIIRNNPLEYTVRFGGLTGARIRRNYMEFQQRVYGESGDPNDFKYEPLFPEITEAALSYTFRSPTGLLNATQFAQPSIMLFDIAISNDLRSRGLFDETAIMTGHSLGEYGALSAYGAITLEDIIDITFIRGMTMQSTVKRDAQHRSDFAMVAANPSRVHKAFDEGSLTATIELIRKLNPSGGLLEIVNYNVRGIQYVVAGMRVQLAFLGCVLDEISRLGVNPTGGESCQVAQIIEALVAGGGCGSDVKRTKATIPIPSIDVPFHSSHLLPGADFFRKCIIKMARLTDSDCSLLRNRYIPNLTAVPFAATPEYFQFIVDQTGSPIAALELSRWPAEGMMTNAEQARLGRVLVEELLSYQFASPVRWIETQDRLLKEYKVERIIEIGPSATLCRMAEGSVKLAGLDSQVSTLHVFRDEDEISFRPTLPEPLPETGAAYEGSRSASQTVTATVSRADSVSGEKVSAPESVVAGSESASTVVEASVEVPDVPLKSVFVIRTVIAQKLKRPLSEVSADRSVKDLTGGKSTLQNEILGDLLKEFNLSPSGPIPDRPDEISLNDLSAGLGSSGGGSGAMRTLGKHTSAQVARLFSTKMPGGVTQSAVRRRLESEHGIARPHQQDAVLLLALTMEPGARLGSEQDAHTWLGSVVQAYAQACGIVLGANGNSAKSNSAQQGKQAVVINSQEFDRAQAAQRALALQQVEAYAQYLGLDIRAGYRLAEKSAATGQQTQHQLDALSDELGPEFLAGIQPKFDARMARVFASYWNWAREDALHWVGQVLAQTDETVDEQARMLMLANRSDALLVQLLSGLCTTLSKSIGDDASVARAYDLAQRMLAACTQALHQAPLVRITALPTQPETSVGVAGSLTYCEVPRANEPTMSEYVAHMQAEPMAANPEHRPLLHLRYKTTAHAWEYAADASREYYACLSELCTSGSSFAGTTALVTGCSRGSIAATVVERLLAGGAKVIATTSSYSKATMRFYESMFKEYGSRGSELIALPFNQGSAADVRSLVAHVFQTLQWGLDYVLPFAAIGDYGRDVSQLDGRSELSVRIMLTNVLRLVGEIRRTKQNMGLNTRPTLAVLPLSPNHGVFGHDGLYGESKAALETAFNRWESEAWGDHVSVAGAVIGWTRGTGLMAANNAIAAALEAAENAGARTFSTNEMALNILALLHPRIAALALHAPVWADLNGGLQRIARVNDAVTNARQALVADVSRRKNIAASAGADIATALGHRVCILHMDHEFQPMFDYRQVYPTSKSVDQLHHLRHLQGMANLDKVVVVTGYGEVSPLGSAETRWEMEAYGEFSLEGCIELAWIMGLIKHVSSAQHTGWVDAKTEEPIRDIDVKARYEEYILAHTGIRLLEPAMLEYPETDPAIVPIFRELLIEHDLPPFEASADEAAQFKLRSGDLADTWANEDGSWSVKLRKGAVLMVPKALRFDRLVGAQLPTGWDPARFGIPPDVVDQVDLVTCFALVATAEALIRSGITDPYELYRYFHISQVGTSVGAGAGGVHAIRAMYHKRLMDKHVQSDVLQETFANTTAAWINMLLLSASGPIKIPTGGCATSVLSFDIAADTIRSGKARVMLAGGFEGFVEEGSYEFAQMGATSNAIDETACGREPSEMSRPCTTTRTGFVEAQGAGIAVLMSAAAAIEYGAPIYAILAHTATATDKQGSSLPAPGMGVLTTAREADCGSASALLDISYRRRQIERGLRAVDAWEAEERADPHPGLDESLIPAMTAAKRNQVVDAWGTEFWRTCPDRISPLRGALAAWGLTPDDIGLASFHGTGTMANDRNESTVLNAQLHKLGRTPGLAVPAVCQKYLTGHPKGPAAAWMLNGALQSLRTGIVPGNRNADNIDRNLMLEFIVYPSRPIHTPGIKAALLKSFGFGQVGAEMLIVHPDYLLATLTEEQLSDYNSRLGLRETQSYRYWQDTFAGNHSLVQIKSSPPYTLEQEERIYLDPLSRASYDAKTKSYHF
ncbi:fatty acid synthase alpha subunit Lsd1 [Coemansia sp. RSA 2050]|nr:fatty acid synthase alpha subunit Lsd1 [Coemansia sp. RSA 2050]KAJ2735170.1 fatty acid synthase alpha subunit Lsd1 [Coemansia sp. BCRC 34962]